ncbi:MAG: FliO/MopB family protein [Alphaproteobacteria bacterium]|nr:FliO/MopB family protein [Alphaproteobacteria bacterium]
MDFATYLKFVLSLGLVLAFFFALVWAARRYLPGMRVGNRAGRRLELVEVLMIDTRRRLILVRRDEVEHLILLGTTSETVIERGIARPPNFAQHLVPPAESP